MAVRIYKSEAAKRTIWETYDRLVDAWGVEAVQRDVETRCGSTHVIECGDRAKPALVLFHGVGDDSALMWIYNAGALARDFHLFAVDTIGGPGKSRPNERYQKGFDDVGWLDEVFKKLGLGRFYLAGVSNGGYMAQQYAISRPERVIRLVALSCSLANTDSKNPIFRMLRVFLPQALFPTKRNVRGLLRKMAGANYAAFTENPAILAHFEALLKGFNNMAMAYHTLRFFDDAQIERIRDKALFLIGEDDPLGDIRMTKEKLERCGLSYRIFPRVGHGINHEIAQEINGILLEWFTGVREGTENPTSAEKQS